MDNGTDILRQLIEQNPAAGAAMDGVKKAMRDQAYNAITSGKADVDQVLSDIVMKFGGVKQPTQQPVEQAQKTPQPVEQPMAQQPATQTAEQPKTVAPELTELQNMAMEVVKKANSPEKMGIIGTILKPIFGMGGDSDEATKKLANIEKAQKIMGQEQTGEGLEVYAAKEKIKTDYAKILEKEKLGNDVMKEKRKFFTENFVKEPTMSSEAISKKGFYSSVKEDTSDLISMFNEDAGVLTRIASPTDEKGKKVKYIIERLRSNLAPARGGAALSKSEMELVENLLPKRGVPAWTQSPELAADAMNKLTQLADRQLNGLDPNMKSREIAKKLKLQGYSDEEIIDVFGRKGLL